MTMIYLDDIPKKVAVSCTKYSYLCIDFDLKHKLVFVWENFVELNDCCCGQRALKVD